MRNYLLGDYLNMTLPVLARTTDAEDELARASIYVFLYLLDAGLRGSQQTIFSDDIQKFASVEVAAAKLFSGHLGSLLLGGVD